MPAPKKYRNTTPFLFNAEVDRFNEFKDLCHRERKSTAQKLNELIVQTIETDGIGKDNPLRISYGQAVQQKITSFNAENPIETIDQFLENGIMGYKQWEPAFRKVDNQEQMERYTNLTEVMYKAAKNRLSFLKTGRAVVETGRIQYTPSMKGTASGL